MPAGFHPSSFILHPLIRVLHVIPSLSLSSGGPSIALPAMAAALVAQGVTVDVVTTDDDGRGLHLAGARLGEWLAMEGGWRRLMFTKQSEFYKVSLGLWRWLRDHAREYDVVHVHAVFSFSAVAACWAARAAGVPYIVRPLGILNGWGMANRRRWMKGLSFRLLDKPLLDAAVAMHYTSGLEQREAESLGLRARGVVIPLGFDVRAMAPWDISTDPKGDAKEERLLFLSRLDRKKGLELLLEAFVLVAAVRPMTHLIVAGNGEQGYVAALKALAVSLGIETRVTWTGHLEGAAKGAAMARAAVFVLPSQSENFGIALLEAMAAGRACVSCEEVALAADVAGEGAVRLALRNPQALAAALLELLADAGAREQLGAKAREVALRDYTLEVMGKRLRSLYEAVVIGAR